MHIKSVVVCGFRSYKEEAKVDSFSKGQNVVIGRNGTGKSNLFDAIRFGLLTERFSNLRQEERQGLLHEGAGKHVMSAYVEITFCNRDGRLPMDTEEVVLRRTIGVKKDEFFLNRKHIPKQEVHHLLESAGFSRSNPYYIVQQGKVNALALMKDKDRLELLKEVAGTKVYEDRRIESLKIIQETQSRREKILEVISYIEGRLDELEGEKNELKEYQELDKSKRALEYMMHEKELQGVRLELEAIERSRVEEVSKSNELHARESELVDIVNKTNDGIHRINQEKEQLIRERSVMEAERNDLMEAKYSLDTEVKELNEGVSQDLSTSKKLAKELEQVKAESAKFEAELAQELVPKYELLVNTLTETKEKLAELTLETDALISKKSRKSQFKTQIERDIFLKSEIKELDVLIDRKELESHTYQDAITLSEHNVKNTKGEVSRIANAMRDHRETISSHSQSLFDLIKKRNIVSEARNDRRREENSLAQEVKRISEELANNESALRKTMAYDVRLGLETVREWRDTGKFRGIYGPLIELVEPASEKICIAMDEAAGGSLFHVVVDTDETATKIMRELEKKNLGRVTFLPLNRLKVSEDVEYVSDEYAIPLIDKLQFSRDIRKAVLSAFGRKLLCRDIQTCAEYAEKTDMDCLTLDGDMVQRRGGLHGGYKDATRSRSRAQMHVKAATAKLEKITKQAKKARVETARADQQVSSVIGEIRKLEDEKKHLTELYEQLQYDHDRLKQQVQHDIEYTSEKVAMLRTWSQEIKELRAKKHVLEIELSQKMLDSLSPEDTKRLEGLQAVLSQVKAQERQQSIELEAIENKKSNVETILRENLQRRQREIQNQIEGSSVWSLQASERENLVQSKTVDFQQAIRAVERHEQQWKELEQDIKQCDDDLLIQQDILEKQKQELNKITKELNDESSKADHILSKRRRLLQKREDVMRDIRELGTLPTTELEKFKDFSSKEISKQFTKCTEKLKSYAHVNKKALDQYVSFSEQRSTLIARKEELDAGDESIKELIDVLDKRKDEAILRTFKGVSHHFTQVFSELVPSGEGKLLILQGDENSSENDTSAFVGVQIKVNFRGEGDSYLMSQLSGGQKALVALAFIFAIQRCDPAPFYLFDEIDQALDSTHRAAVAALIKRQADSEENPAQFITSTFRPELVMVSDQFYGISHQNKISNIQPLTKEESLDFIADIMASDEAVESQ